MIAAEHNLPYLNNKSVSKAEKVKMKGNMINHKMLVESAYELTLNKFRLGITIRFLTTRGIVLGYKF